MTNSDEPWRWWRWWWWYRGRRRRNYTQVQCPGPGERVEAEAGVFRNTCRTLVGRWYLAVRVDTRRRKHAVPSYPSYRIRLRMALEEFTGPLFAIPWTCGAIPRANGPSETFHAIRVPRVRMTSPLSVPVRECECPERSTTTTTATVLRLPKVKRPVLFFIYAAGSTVAARQLDLNSVGKMRVTEPEMTRTRP